MPELQNPYAAQILSAPIQPFQHPCLEWEGVQQYAPQAFTRFDLQDHINAEKPFVDRFLDVLYSSHHGLIHPPDRPNQNAEYLQLLQYYTFVDSQHIIEDFLVEESSYFSLLNEAVEPLRAAFGEVRLIRVKAQAHDDDKMLRVTVQLPSNMNSDPEDAIHRFDTDWWLDNCHRSRGGLVFDYEIQDAV
jgi:hypothetical protein